MRRTISVFFATALLLTACGENPELLAPGAFAPGSSNTPFEIDSPSHQNASRSAADQYAWVTISWDGAQGDAAVNLDLHVVDPTGVEVNLTRTVTGTARFLEHPECISYDCSGDETNPSETIFWKLDNLPPGEYRAWVENISERGSSYDVEIMFGDQQIQESGSVSGGQRSGDITWDVEEPERAAPSGTCMEQLDQLGIRYQEITIREGSCRVEDAVMVSGPINGITYKVDYARSTTRFRTSCEIAVKLHEYGTVMKGQGVDTVYHNGSYNCRNINGSSSLSTHGLARAMDFNGFRANGQEYNVLRDWDSASKGQLLRALVSGARGLFSTILTPDSNADHADHFHMDIGR